MKLVDQHFQTSQFCCAICKYTQGKKILVVFVPLHFHVSQVQCFICKFILERICILLKFVDLHFSEKWTLVYHMQTQTGDKPYFFKFVVCNSYVNTHWKESIILSYMSLFFTTNSCSLCHVLTRTKYKLYSWGV